MKKKWLYLVSAFFMLFTAILVAYMFTIDEQASSDSVINQQFSSGNMTEDMRPVKNLIPRNMDQNGRNGFHEEEGFPKFLAPKIQKETPTRAVEEEKIDTQNIGGTASKKNSQDAISSKSNTQNAPEKSLDSLVFSATDVQTDAGDIQDTGTGKASDEDVEAALSKFTESMSNDSGSFDFEIVHDADNTDNVDDTILPNVADIMKDTDSGKVLITKSGLFDRPNENVITYMELRMNGDQVSLAMEGNNPIKAKAFSIKNPDRVVLDLEGVWAMKLPQVISNRMVKSLRQGGGENYTRVVFDLKVKPTKIHTNRLNAKTIRLIFR